MNIRDEEFLKDLDSIAAILADGYPGTAGTAAKIHLIQPPKRALMDMRLTPPRKEKDLQIQIHAQIEALRRMTVRELRGRYREVFGEESRSNHKQFLFRRIAWRLQAVAEGDLSERARRRTL